MSEYIEKIQNSAEYIKSVLGGITPEIGIILGSGLGSIAEMIANPTTIPYSEIKDFPKATAIGHKGNFIVGDFGGKKVIAMQGRFHYYEGHPMELVVMPVRVMAKLGIKTLLVSNAAGGLKDGFKVGDLMIISDHINLQPNPLIGPNADEFGPRFPDMTRPYDLKLIALAREIAAESGIEIQQGTYVSFTGPSYETPAEIRYAKMIGGDAVGMSTTPEVIVARHMNIPVFGMSVITDVSTGAEDYTVDEQEVIKAADAASVKMTGLFKALIERL